MRKKRTPQGIADRILCEKTQGLRILRKTPPNERGTILLHLPRACKTEILHELSNKEINAIIHYLDPDESIDLLQYISRNRREKIISSVNRDTKQKIEFLLKFEPHTAAGMMNLNYITAEKTETLADVIKAARKHERRTGEFPVILVVNKGLFIGDLPGYIIALHKKSERVSKFVRPLPHVAYDAKEKDVIAIFKNNPHQKVVVLDKDKSIIGVIPSDYILNLIQKKSEQSFYGFAGVHQEEDIFDTPLMKVQHRYRWLLLNLCTLSLAAVVVGLFEHTISKFVLLVAYMPIIAGMGGNAGTQTLAVVVRGLALKEIHKELARRIILNEVIAGAINGLIVGVVIAFIASYLNYNPVLGAIIGLSLIVNLVIAGFFGSLMPLVMKRLGKDPATSATVFITAATDVCGFFVFLGLASVLL